MTKSLLEFVVLNDSILPTAPCVPQNLVPAFDCDLKVASLTWNASAGAELYVVVAESGEEQRLELSTNVTEAYFSELACGQTYSLTVAAVGQGCRSAESAPVLIQTGTSTRTQSYYCHTKTSCYVTSYRAPGSDVV